eukprot:gnl/TRDRNA2_/TRDRNA2_149735_c1_seq2.p1 gnl/TRDRNA2_/TRDRNA2_149735_c1~~gnl/TRDRNA2_/TRDRNA2_149735_c1_seq2.p1  ORF type:complete len:268 (+),score=31.14 gnl/TRDRNA2_/TRDRNA2_149735_c1_seq2:44-847(+)
MIHLFTLACFLASLSRAGATTRVSINAGGNTIVADASAQKSMMRREQKPTVEVPAIPDTDGQADIPSNHSNPMKDKMALPAASDAENDKFKKTPWPSIFQTLWNDLCMDHDPSSNNVQMKECKKDNRANDRCIEIGMEDTCKDQNTDSQDQCKACIQKWTIDPLQRLHTVFASRLCLGAESSDERANVKMVECDQQGMDMKQSWYFVSDKKHLKNAGVPSTSCLDYHPRTHNVYMYPCHTGNNQKWIFPALPDNAMPTSSTPTMSSS